MAIRVQRNDVMMRPSPEHGGLTNKHAETGMDDLERETKTRRRRPSAMGDGEIAGRQPRRAAANLSRPICRAVTDACENTRASCSTEMRSAMLTPQADIFPRARLGPAKTLLRSESLAEKP